MNTQAPQTACSDCNRCTEPTDSPYSTRVHNVTISPLAYADNDTELEGMLFRPQTAHAAILLVHEFMGLEPSLLQHAQRLAEQGYVVLACDMYGKGIRPTTAEEASLYSRIYRADRIKMRQRIQAAFTALSSHPSATGLPVMSLGFSFGGCAVLELARSGAPVAATCSVYGYLNTSHPLPGSSAKSIPAGPMLVLHGSHDRVVPLAEVAPFVEEMQNAHISCRVNVYTDAGHGFCNETLVRDDRYNSWYCPDIAARAWREILTFFAEAAVR